MALRLRERLNRGFFALGRKIAWGIDDMFTRNSRVGTPAFFDPKLFPWIPALEAATPNIRRELDMLLGHIDDLPNFQDLSPDQRYLTDDAGWKTYFFCAFGLPVPKACKRWPLRFPASLVNWLLTWGIALSPFVFGAAGRHLAWERRFERVMNEARPGAPPAEAGPRA